MDKLLAMSILSWGPNFSGDGWFGRGWIGRKNEEEENKGGSDKSGTVSVAQAKKLEQLQKRNLGARFAVELDGLHCFETIVPQ